MIIIHIIFVVPLASAAVAPDIHVNIVGIIIITVIIIIIDGGQENSLRRSNRRKDVHHAPLWKHDDLVELLGRERGHARQQVPVAPQDLAQQHVDLGGVPVRVERVLALVSGARSPRGDVAAAVVDVNARVAIGSSSSRVIIIIIIIIIIISKVGLQHHDGRQRTHGHRRGQEQGKHQTQAKLPPVGVHGLGDGEKRATVRPRAADQVVVEEALSVLFC